MFPQNQACGESKKPGKIILFGEHFVVYQAPALAMPVHSLHLVCQAYSHQSDTSFDMLLNISHLQQQALNLLGISKKVDYQLNILSTIPIGKGLGSSASLCVAIIEALAVCSRIILEKSQLIAFANDLEKTFHHFPSGLDVTTIVENCPIYFHSLDSYHALCQTAEIQFLIIDTGIKRNTKSAVLAVRELKRNQPMLFQKCFSNYLDIAETARLAFEKGNFSSIPQLMTENQKLLKTIGVSHSSIDEFIVALENYGLLGTKISGAGLGGILIIPIITPHQHLLQTVEIVNEVCSHKRFETFHPLGVS